MEIQTKYLLLGGGVASVNAVMGIRGRDPDGSIVMAGAETWMPYDRPPLSKGFLVKDLTPDDISSKFDNFYPDNGVELKLGFSATKLDLVRRRVQFESGEEIGYEKLLVATGASPRPLSVPGDEHKNVHLLRTIDDALLIRESLSGASRCVILGAGFMGMEVASVFQEKGIETTVLCPEEHPWAMFASPILGNFMQGYFEGRGVRFMTRETAVAIHEGSEVITQAGVRIPCGMVIVGAGVRPNVRFALDGGLQGDAESGITTDHMLQTSDPSVYAAGDVANFYDQAIGRHWRCEHHLNARWQGASAGANMAGANEPYDRVAYLYSDLFDIHMILRGDPTERRESKVLGSFDEGEFVELYYDDAHTLRMGVAISHDEPKLDPISDKLDELIRAKARVQELTPEDFGL